MHIYTYIYIHMYTAYLAYAHAPPASTPSLMLLYLYRVVKWYEGGIFFSYFF